MSERDQNPADDPVDTDIAEGLWDDAMADAFGSEATAPTTTEIDDPPSVLVRLEARLGKAPECVHLPDDLLDEDGATLVDTQSTAVVDAGRRVGRYLLLGELARGGMGVVLHGRDLDLGRDVAIKVLQDEYAEQPAMVQRFIEEAQVAGQLQHPGVIPVYEIGIDASRRPFFSMKLVRGRTLSALLHEREGPQADLPRFLHIYEQVCQTLAYGHARRVVHRDVKPANIMVGAFGEVQVMDWGMAKVLSRGGVEDEALDQEPTTRIETVRSDGRGSQSLAGSVLGTPSYMPPEQAQGHVVLVDERADVFALGGILCEILTGHPPYVREPGSSPIQKAQAASLEGAMERLEGCAADPELKALTRTCLAPDLRERPRDASVVAREVAAYLAGAERRAEEAQVEAKAARVRARAERKARRLTVALAGAALAVVVLVGGGLWWQDATRRAERARNDQRVGTAILEAGAHMDGRRWEAADAALQGARGLVRDGRVGSDAVGDLEAAMQRLKAERAADLQRVAREERDAALVVRLREIRNQPVVDPSSSDDEYAEAFEGYGLLVDAGEPPDIAAMIRSAGGATTEALIFALDDWAGRRRLMSDDDRWRRLVRIARLADDDAWRSGLRDALLDNALDRLKSLAKGVAVEGQHPGSLALLGMSLYRNSEREVALDLLRQACEAHPKDYWVHQQLAVALVGEFKIEDGRTVRHESSSPKELEEAELHLRIALVLQSDSTFNMAFLGTVLHRRGQTVDALAYLSTKLERYEDDAALMGARWQVMLDEDRDAAIAELDERKPSGPFGRLALERARQLGLGLSAEPEREIERLRAKVAAEPTNGLARTDLARLLLQVGDLEGAADHAFEATGLRGDRPQGWQLFARSLLERGRFAEAKQAFAGARGLGGLRGISVELERLARIFDDRERELERQRVSGNDPFRTEQRTDLARYCAFTGHPKRAVGLFKKVVAARSAGGRRPPGGRGRMRPPTEILFEAGLAGVLAGDLDFARTCLEQHLLADDRGPRGPGGRGRGARGPGSGRERRGRGPTTLQLHRWRHDRRLAPVRSREALDRMSEPARKAWAELWGKVDARLASPR